MSGQGEKWGQPDLSTAAPAKYIAVTILRTQSSSLSVRQWASSH